MRCEREGECGGEAARQSLGHGVHTKVLREGQKADRGGRARDRDHEASLPPQLIAQANGRRGNSERNVDPKRHKTPAKKTRDVVCARPEVPLPAEEGARDEGEVEIPSRFRQQGRAGRDGREGESGIDPLSSLAPQVPVALPGYLTDFAAKHF